MLRNIMQHILLICCTFFCLTLTACSNTKEYAISGFSFTTNTVSVAFGQSVQSYTPFEEGYIYCENGCVKAMDFNSGKSRVLCSRPNCKHLDDSCSAYIGYFTGGFATYCNGKVYFIHENFNTGNHEIISMDTDGTNRKTIASLNWLKYEIDKEIYQINSISYMSNNLAIIDCEIGKISDNSEYSEIQSDDVTWSNAVLILDLVSGKCVSVISDFSLKTAYPDCLIIQRRVYDSELISESDFHDYYNTEYSDYHEYLSWFYENHVPINEVAIYYIDKDAIEILYRDTLQKRPLPNGSLDYYPCKGIIGLYNGTFYYYDVEYLQEDSSLTNLIIYKHNIDTAISEVIYEIHNGAILIVNAAELYADCIIDGGKIFYKIYDSDIAEKRKTCDVYYLDLKSENTEYCFSDVWNNKYWVRGETKEFFLMTKGFDSGIYKILKSDYYIGDFSNLTHYNLNKSDSLFN